MVQLFFQLGAAGFGKAVELGIPAAFGEAPFRSRPTLLFQTVQAGIKGALGNLKGIVRDLLDAFRKGPAMLGLARKRFENQQIQCALNELGGLAHS